MFSATPNLTTEVLSLKLIYLNLVLECVDPKVVTSKSGVKSDKTVVGPSSWCLYLELWIIKLSEGIFNYFGCKAWSEALCSDAIGCFGTIRKLDFWVNKIQYWIC